MSDPRPQITRGSRRRPPVFMTAMLTPEIQHEICQYLEIMVPLKYAAEAAGVGESTVHRWIEIGRSSTARPEDGQYVEFAAAVEKARAKAVPNLHVKALGGGKGSQQATWFLERLKRDEYGPVQRVEHAIPLDDLAAMTDDDLIREHQARLRKLGAFRAATMEAGVPEEPDGVDHRGAEPDGADASAASPAAAEPPPGGS